MPLETTKYDTEGEARHFLSSHRITAHRVSRPCVPIVHPIADLWFYLFISIEGFLVRRAHPSFSQLNAVPLTRPSSPSRWPRGLSLTTYVTGLPNSSAEPNSKRFAAVNLKETDKSAPPDGALVFIPISTHTLGLRILLTMCGVSMLQIFEPFSPRCSTYAGKLNEQRANCASWQ